MMPLMELDENGQPGIGHDVETTVLIGGILSQFIVACLTASDELVNRLFKPCFCMTWLCKYWSLVKYLLHVLHLLFDGKDRPFWHAWHILYLVFRDSSMALAPTLSTSCHLALDSAKTCQSGWIRKAYRSLYTQSCQRSFGLRCGCLPIIHEIESSLEVCGLPSAKDGPATST